MPHRCVAKCGHPFSSSTDRGLPGIVDVCVLIYIIVVFPGKVNFSSLLVLHPHLYMCVYCTAYAHVICLYMYVYICTHTHTHTSTDDR